MDYVRFRQWSPPTRLGHFIHPGTIFKSAEMVPGLQPAAASLGHTPQGPDPRQVAGRVWGGSAPPAGASPGHQMAWHHMMKEYHSTSPEGNSAQAAGHGAVVSNLASQGVQTSAQHMRDVMPHLHETVQRHFQTGLHLSLAAAKSTIEKAKKAKKVLVGAEDPDTGKWHEVGSPGFKEAKAKQQRVLEEKHGGSEGLRQYREETKHKRENPLGEIGSKKKTGRRRKAEPPSGWGVAPKAFGRDIPKGDPEKKEPKAEAPKAAPEGEAPKAEGEKYIPQVKVGGKWIDDPKHTSKKREKTERVRGKKKIGEKVVSSAEFSPPGDRGKHLEAKPTRPTTKEQQRAARRVKAAERQAKPKPEAAQAEGFEKLQETATARRTGKFSPKKTLPKSELKEITEPPEKAERIKPKREKTKTKAAAETVSKTPKTTKRASKPGKMDAPPQAPQAKRTLGGLEQARVLASSPKEGAKIIEQAPKPRTPGPEQTQSSTVQALGMMATMPKFKRKEAASTSHAGVTSSSRKMGEMHTAGQAAKEKVHVHTDPTTGQPQHPHPSQPVTAEPKLQEHKAPAMDPFRIAPKPAQEAPKPPGPSTVFPSFGVGTHPTPAAPEKSPSKAPSFKTMPHTASSTGGPQLAAGSLHRSLAMFAEIEKARKLVGGTKTQATSLGAAPAEKKPGFMAKLMGAKTSSAPVSKPVSQMHRTMARAPAAQAGAGQRMGTATATPTSTATPTLAGRGAGPKVDVLRPGQASPSREAGRMGLQVQGRGDVGGEARNQASIAAESAKAAVKPAAPEKASRPSAQPASKPEASAQPASKPEASATSGAAEVAKQQGKGPTSTSTGGPQLDRPKPIGSAYGSLLGMAAAAGAEAGGTPRGGTALVQQAPGQVAFRLDPASVTPQGPSASSGSGAQVSPSRRIGLGTRTTVGRRAAPGAGGPQSSMARSLNAHPLVRGPGALRPPQG